MSLPKNKKAFTLIELLVVIVIIGILSAIGFTAFSNAQKKGRDARRKADLKNIQAALEYYYQVNGKYPNSTDSFTTPNFSIQCNTATDTHVISWGDTFKCDSTTYMKTLPKDPLGNQYYYSYYAVTTQYTKYCLGTVLENTNDPEITKYTSGDYVNAQNICLIPSGSTLYRTGSNYVRISPN